MDRSRKGFTLIEVMVVVAIIACLGAMAIPHYLSYRKTAQVDNCLNNLSLLDAASKAYIIQRNLPSDVEITLDQLVPPSAQDASRAQYFIMYLPKCPAGGDYKYDTTRQSWYCSLGGGPSANGGYPHGSGKGE